MSGINSALSTFETAPGKKGQYYSLPALEKAGFGAVSRLPVSIRIVLESLVRNMDNERVREEDVRRLAAWKPGQEGSYEIPFVVSRVLLQDFTGVPLIVDLAAMRSAMVRLKKDPKRIEPLVPVDLVIDHSVQVDAFGTANAFNENLGFEFGRNEERYRFLKWGKEAFNSLEIVPPGIGIVHQVNVEYLAECVSNKDGVYFPDTLVGTDSHTTMVNGLGVVAWGVGGIEAEAAMLGQPASFAVPEVVGVELTGKTKEGVTATDVVLRVTEILRKANVVGKFVEFFGEGAARLAATERTTIANMAPEYGATMGFFPADEMTCRYLEMTGRTAEQVGAVRSYLKAQNLFGMPKKGDIDYTQEISLDLSTVEPAMAGPKRPQDRITLTEMKGKWLELLEAPAPKGYGKTKEKQSERFPITDVPGSLPVFRGQKLTGDVGHGDVLIAAITSCTNTSNPSVMLGAGLVAKKAIERGLTVSSRVKTSLAPGSRVVTDYLEKTGLQKYLDQLGFNLVGYGCTTCIGNSGPLDAGLEKTLNEKDVVGASVLSGNRNFEARVHQAIKANFLASPMLVVAYAIAGRVGFDPTKEPLAKDKNGVDVFLKDIWPSNEEIDAVMGAASDPAAYRARYANLGTQTERWTQVPSPKGEVFDWDGKSTYVREPPYFENFSLDPKGSSSLVSVKGARALALFGDSITTDHISPAGSIKTSSPAGKYLQANAVGVDAFNSYGARRGNHEVMVRGTFANVRIKNMMKGLKEGGVTFHRPSNEELSIYDAAERYRGEKVPLIVFAGREYGTGSSRDWAAKGTRLLGVRAVLAISFERIHRSNLVGMGVLPCELPNGVTAETLGLTGEETFDLTGVENMKAPREELTLSIVRPGGKTEQLQVKVRVDTLMELEYLRHGGILPFVFRRLARD